VAALFVFTQRAEISEEVMGGELGVGMIVAQYPPTTDQGLLV
jgi:hypothetical protein